MTESEALSIGQETEAVRYSASSGIQRAGARGRATSVTPLPSGGDGAVTDSGHPAAELQQRAQGFADSIAAKARTWCGDIPPLGRDWAAAFEQRRQHVHAAASYQDVPLLNAGRLAYGYLHLLFALGLDIAKAGLDAVRETTRSPWGLVIAAVAVFVFIHW